MKYKFSISKIIKFKYRVILGVLPTCVLHATSYLAFNVLCHNLAPDNAFNFIF